MYHMKNIILHNEDITLPKCMYYVKKIIEFDEPININTEINLHISEQVNKFLKVYFDLFFSKNRCINIF